MRSRPALAVPVLAVVVAACSLSVPRQVGTVIPAGAGGAWPAVPVDVVDPGGLVDSIAVGAPNSVDEPGGQGGIVAVPDWPTAAVVSWTGGVCDIRTTATVGARDAAIVVRLQTSHRSGTCWDMGIHRSVTLVFNKPIDGRQLVRELDPTR